MALSNGFVIKFHPLAFIVIVYVLSDGFKLPVPTVSLTLNPFLLKIQNALPFPKLNEPPGYSI